MKFSLPIYSRGKQVWYEGRPYYVDHVTINGYDLWINLEGIDKAIYSEKIQVEPTVFDTTIKTRNGNGDNSNNPM